MKTRLLLIAALLMAAACTKSADRELLDRTGAKVTVGPVNRIISTAPSNTEIIVDLGMADKLVAVDRWSVDVAGLPGGLPTLDFFYPDAEVIVGLEPDLILANGHNATGTGEDPFRLLREMGVPVAYISMSKSINDIYEDIAFVADLLQSPEKGRALIDSMRAQIDEIARAARALEHRKSVYFEISPAPEIFTFGKDSYLNDMISVIGAENIFGNDNWIVTPGAEAIIDRNPDVILTNVNYIDDPIGELKSRPGFDHINAVINNRIYQIDTNSSVRPSSRIILALRQMARAVYPEIYGEQ
ncbi:MAG: ABC transporter substrate-binding protein [Treponema sp.]|jgi:iron complex transport system substrate-binding protein|nr:ABC transporter substrate-binding protein [Treponema sp.]